MNKHFFTRSFFALMISGAFLLSACYIPSVDPCEDQTAEFDLSADSKSKVAYEGHESLTFVRFGTGDTHTFTGRGRLAYESVVFDNSGDCSNKAIHKGFTIEFISSTFPESKILLKAYDADNGFDLLDLQFKKQLFTGSLPGIRWPFYAASLYVGSILYRDLNLISKISLPDTNKYILYNPTSGIVKIKMPDGETWGLLKKE